MIRRFLRSRTLPVVATAALLAVSAGPSLAGATTAPRNEIAIELSADSALGGVLPVLKSVGWAVTRRVFGSHPIYVANPKGLLASVESTVVKLVSLVPGVRAVEDNFLFGVDRDFGGKQSQAPVLRDDLSGASMCTQPALGLVGLGGDAGSGPAPAGAPPPPPPPPGPIVAVVDGGFDLSHEAFSRARLMPGVDVLDGDSDVNDLGNGRDDDGNGIVDEGVGHGNAVLAVVSIVAPNARLLPIRALDDEKTASVADLTAGLWAALDGGAAVVNMSVGATQSSRIFDNALASASARGVVVVAPAGNSGTCPLLYPASSGYAVGVVGTDACGAKDPVSNYGGAAEIGAPSVDVVAPFPRTSSKYGLWRGTSFAAPFHAGAVAVVMQATGMSAKDSSRTIVSSAQAYSYVPPEDQGGVGSGVLDLRRFPK